MINYSIIIPHKNSPDLLQRCLASIPCRDDVQVIVVDDASDDIFALKKIVVLFPHVELVETNEKKGAGYVRNVGLSKVKGKWILFADADDFFHENFIERLDLYKDSNYDIIYFDTDSCYSDNLVQTNQRIPNISVGVANKNLDMLKWQVTVVWGKMYSSKLILQKKILFEEVLASNDVMFAYQCSFYSQQCVIDPFVLYTSTINKNSLCFSMNLRNLDARVNVRLRANEYLRSIGKRKFQVNMFGLVLYSKRFGWKVFFKCICKYLKNVTTYSLFVIDIPNTVKGCLKKILGKSNSASKSQSLTKDSFYK